MEEIELKELFEHFKNNLFKFSLIVFSICLVGCLYALFFQKPSYTSSTTLVLTSMSENSNSSITMNEINLNSQLVSTYREIAKSRKVVEQVIDELELNTSYEALASSINVSSVNDTEIIRISVVNVEPEKAKEIADTLAIVFSKEIQEIYNVKNTSILDEANMPTSASNINIPKQIITYFGIGLVVACAFLFLIFYFDTTIKSVEQVEQKIGLPILGAVPNYNIKRRKK